MVRRIVFSAAIVGMGLLIHTAVPVHAGGKSDSEVKITAETSKLDDNGKQLLKVTLVHNRGWHTYANPVGNKDFEDNSTVVAVNAKAKPVSVKIEYPLGKVKKDKVVGDYKIYEDKVEIRAVVQRVPDDKSPLEVSVRIIACHDKGVCLLPATVKLNVP